MSERLGPTRYGIERVRRHAHWLRTEGLRRLVEEDQLDPIERWRTARSKAAWRAEHESAVGAAAPLFVFGLQRSGTNMVVRGLERMPEVEVFNENDRRAFDRFRLVPDDQVTALVGGSRHRVVLFKPLCDSHRAAELLDLDPGKARALWVVRRMDDRVRSAVAKFGDANRRALVAIAHGLDEGRWESGGLSQDDRSLVSELEPEHLTPHDAAALFWALRNRLYFRQGLDRRGSVMLVSYDRFVASPEPHMAAMTRFIGLPVRSDPVDGVDGSRGSGSRLELDPRIRSLCDQVQAQLDDVLAAAES